MQTEQTIRNYFKTFVKKELHVDDNLFTMGIVDSMGIVSLIAYIEEHLGIAIDPDDINEENFSTLQAITALVDRRKA